jgi:two-component system chemotaxis response regulator CheB
VARVRPVFARSVAPNQTDIAPIVRPELRFRTTDQIVAIGASTGGTEAVREVLRRMPADSPGMVITQHIPRAFSAPFAARLNACSQLSVQEAQDGALILPGQAYIAPGDRHLTVERDGARYRCRLRDDAPVNRHRPSVDVLFRSVAEQVGRNAVGVILTGMGADGARGLKEMRSRGAHTIAQDEKSSVVWGMPGAAVALGAVDCILPIERIAEGLAGLNEEGEERLAAGS